MIPEHGNKLKRHRKDEEAASRANKLARTAAPSGPQTCPGALPTAQSDSTTYVSASAAEAAHHARPPVSEAGLRSASDPQPATPASRHKPLPGRRASTKQEQVAHVPSLTAKPHAAPNLGQGQEIGCRQKQKAQYDDPLVAHLVELLEEQARELPGDKAVQEGLSSVKRMDKILRHSQWSQLSFFFGNLNFAFTAFLLGFRPEHFWVWQLCKCTVLMCVSVRLKTAAKKQLWLLEFCWIMNFISLGLGAACAVAPFSPAAHHLVNSPRTFRSIFAIANGPLAWAVLALSNAFVMYDLDNMASLYIHMSPAVMSWTFRWYTDRILQAYGGERFSLPGLTEEVAASVTVFDIVLPGAMVYLAWMVPYTLWLLICGIHHSPTTTGKETSWNDLCTQKKSPLPMLLCLGRQDPAELVADRLRALQYNLTQFAFSAVAMSLSALMWHSFTLHTAFLLCIILYAIYVGSAKIHRSMMRWYLRPFGVLEEVKRRALEQKRE